jgi:hypothetical protein
MAIASAPLEPMSGWFLRRAYAGQVPLWKTFWLFLVPVIFALYGLYIGVLWCFLHFFHLVRVDLFAFPASLFIFLCLSVPCSAVWRCATNSRHRYCGYLARVFVVAYLLWYGHKVFSLWSVFRI